MTYELARISAEVYEKGSELKGRANIQTHINLRIGTRQTWMSPKSIPETLQIISDTSMLINEKCFFLKVAAMGLTRDDVCNGDMDFEMSVRTIGDVWGKLTTNQICAIADQNAVWYDSGIRHITFVGVFSKESDNTWKIHGVLPMDERLLSIAVSDVGKP